MKKIISRLLVLVAAITGVIALNACSKSAEPVAVSPQTVVIDVRTPEEYDAGHLEGATLLDLNGGEFAAALPTLDPQAQYVVYCRSGNRSGQAVKMMEDAGFTSVTNLGSVEEASSSTGLPIVTD